MDIHTYKENIGNGKQLHSAIVNKIHRVSNPDRTISNGFKFNNNKKEDRVKIVLKHTDG